MRAKKKTILYFEIWPKNPPKLLLVLHNKLSFSKIYLVLEEITAGN